MADEPVPSRGAPPKSVVAPPSILGSRTTRAAFILVALSLAVVAAAFLFVWLRPRPELPGAAPANDPSAAGR